MSGNNKKFMLQNIVPTNYFNSSATYIRKGNGLIHLR